MDSKPEDMEVLVKAAQDGDVEAQTALGTALAAGAGGAKDLEGAHLWLRRAAAGGNTTAMFNLGIMHEKGLGTPADSGEAACWFWQAAELGDAGARIKLGTMFLKGQGFSPGSPAVSAIEASAEAGEPYAMSFLAKLRLDGVGVPRDEPAAEKLFRLAARKGDESAIYNLGEMAVEGRTSVTSGDEIADWFFGLGRANLEKGDLVRAFDCLVSIKRVDPGHFLAKRLEEEIEKANQDRLQHD